MMSASSGHRHLGEQRKGAAGTVGQGSVPSSTIKVNGKFTCAKRFKFRNEKFFLDLKGFTGQEKLEADILSVGGTVERFLSRDVTCVVSNRQHDLRDVKNLPPPTNKSSAALSRGQALLLRANNALSLSAVVQSPGDPLHFAENWNIPIVDVVVVLDAAKRQTSVRDMSLVRTSAAQVLRKSFAQKLDGTYLKVEDEFCRHRPLFVSLKSIPALNLCKNSDRGPFETPMTTTCRNASEQKLSNDARERKRKSADGVRYCEICDEMYLKLTEHLESSRHQQFCSESENFVQLDSLISSLPSVQQFDSDELTMHRKLTDRCIAQSDLVTEQPDNCSRTLDTNDTARTRGNDSGTRLRDVANGAQWLDDDNEARLDHADNGARFYRADNDTLLHQADNSARLQHADNVARLDFTDNSTRLHGASQFTTRVCPGACDEDPAVRHLSCRSSTVLAERENVVENMNSLAGCQASSSEADVLADVSCGNTVSSPSPIMLNDSQALNPSINPNNVCNVKPIQSIGFSVSAERLDIVQQCCKTSDGVELSDELMRSSNPNLLQQPDKQDDLNPSVNVGARESLYLSGNRIGFESHGQIRNTAQVTLDNDGSDRTVMAECEDSIVRNDDDATDIVEPFSFVSGPAELNHVNPDDELSRNEFALRVCEVANPHQNEIPSATNSAANNATVDSCRQEFQSCFLFKDLSAKPAEVTAAGSSESSPFINTSENSDNASDWRAKIRRTCFSVVSALTEDSEAHDAAHVLAKDVVHDVAHGVTSQSMSDRQALYLDCQPRSNESCYSSSVVSLLSPAVLSPYSSDTPKADCLDSAEGYTDQVSSKNCWASVIPVSHTSGGISSDKSDNPVVRNNFVRCDKTLQDARNVPLKDIYDYLLQASNINVAPAISVTELRGTSSTSSARLSRASDLQSGTSSSANNYEPISDISNGCVTPSKQSIVRPWEMSRAACGVSGKDSESRNGAVGESFATKNSFCYESLALNGHAKEFTTADTASDREATNVLVGETDSTMHCRFDLATGNIDGIVGTDGGSTISHHSKWTALPTEATMTDDGYSVAHQSCAKQPEYVVSERVDRLLAGNMADSCDSELWQFKPCTINQQDCSNGASNEWKGGCSNSASNDWKGGWSNCFPVETLQSDDNWRFDVAKVNGNVFASVNSFCSPSLDDDALSVDHFLLKQDTRPCRDQSGIENVLQSYSASNSLTLNLQFGKNICGENADPGGVYSDISETYEPDENAPKAISPLQGHQIGDCFEEDSLEISGGKLNVAAKFSLDDTTGSRFALVENWSQDVAVDLSASSKLCVPVLDDVMSHCRAKAISDCSSPNQPEQSTVCHEIDTDNYKLLGTARSSGASSSTIKLMAMKVVTDSLLSDDMVDQQCSMSANGRDTLAEFDQNDLSGDTSTNIGGDINDSISYLSNMLDQFTKNNKPERFQSSNYCNGISLTAEDAIYCNYGTTGDVSNASFVTKQQFGMIVCTASKPLSDLRVEDQATANVTYVGDIFRGMERAVEPVVTVDQDGVIDPTGIMDMLRLLNGEDDKRSESKFVMDPVPVATIKSELIAPKLRHKRQMLSSHVQINIDGPSVPVCAAPAVPGITSVPVCAATGVSGRTSLPVCAAPGVSGRTPVPVCAAPGVSGRTPVPVCAAPGVSGRTPVPVCAAPGVSGRTPLPVCAAPGVVGRTPVSVCAAPGVFGRTSFPGSGEARSLEGQACTDYRPHLQIRDFVTIDRNCELFTLSSSQLCSEGRSAYDTSSSLQNSVSVSNTSQQNHSTVRSCVKSRDSVKPPRRTVGRKRVKETSHSSFVSEHLDAAKTPRSAQASSAAHLLPMFFRWKSTLCNSTTLRFTKLELLSS